MMIFTNSYLYSSESLSSLDLFKKYANSYYFHIIVANENYTSLRSEFVNGREQNARDLSKMMQEQFNEAQKYYESAKSVLRNLNSMDRDKALLFVRDKQGVSYLFPSLEDAREHAALISLNIQYIKENESDQKETTERITP